ncbi:MULTISPECIES: hypothetical protein [Rhodanobacter]|jgi:hypothetical protein|uniref:Uncharacterized protein n=1 Tax=Rhodanobacter denitrificans TaxID=666685 RepID=M4NHZ6_9GAMM|nr:MULTISPECIES: hypothetical protein [Rhodanobacter]HJW05306.1 hypothetical protein [Rhodanobacter sp.]AGG89727.1 hypothetical protein R2APBS1_2645 [Rhodanobacter denitrificans]UJJ49920.1 hypothetical protein LRK52_11840 [Rhodanobacter denitrificans]UJJ57888.1 hypothetical protein LRK55_14600 [Rhodanobacter denitrificans]UJM85125.1 hypothetical protein LRJ86_10060 [Rhodanobacter denitrificans]
MSKTTSKENQNTPAVPPPADNETDAAASEPVAESGLTGTPTPDQATNPMIKNT